MDILSKIIKKKKEELEYLKKNVSISELEKSIYFNSKTNSLVNSINVRIYQSLLNIKENLLQNPILTI